MLIYHSNDFILPLPKEHRFPMDKYRLLKENVEKYLTQPYFHHQILQAPTLSDEQIKRVHDHAYVDGIIQGSLALPQLRRIGFPWSTQMVERCRRSSGATLAAAESALKYGRGVNLAGGTHHAYRAQGGGYCVFNDSAIAVKNLEYTGKIRRSLIIDLDVHQGDGTAEILGNDPQHFCFSMHGENNYPFHKMKSDLDIPLPDGCGDELYLSLLDQHLSDCFEKSKPDLVIYIAGADPYQGDQLGKLKLTQVGLAQRDQMVFECADRYGTPVAMSMGGGYAKNIEEIANIHCNSVLIAAGEMPILDSIL